MTLIARPCRTDFTHSRASVIDLHHLNTHAAKAGLIVWVRFLRFHLQKTGTREPFGPDCRNAYIVTGAWPRFRTPPLKPPFSQWQCLAQTPGMLQQAAMHAMHSSSHAWLGTGSSHCEHCRACIHRRQRCRAAPGMVGMWLGSLTPPPPLRSQAGARIVRRGASRSCGNT